MEQEEPAFDDAHPARSVVLAFRFLHVQASRNLGLVARAHGIAVIDLRALVQISTLETALPSRVSAYLQLSSGATTTLIDRLVASDLLLRRPNPDDRRSIRLELTAAGRSVVDEILLLHERALSAAVPLDDARSTAALFVRLAHAFGDEHVEHDRRHRLGSPDGTLSVG